MYNCAKLMGMKWDIDGILICIFHFQQGKLSLLSWLYLNGLILRYLSW